MYTERLLQAIFISYLKFHVSYRIPHLNATIKGERQHLTVRKTDVYSTYIFTLQVILSYAGISKRCHNSS